MKKRRPLKNIMRQAPCGPKKDCGRNYKMNTCIRIHTYRFDNNRNIKKTDTSCCKSESGAEQEGQSCFPSLVNIKPSHIYYSRIHLTRPPPVLHTLQYTRYSVCFYQHLAITRLFLAAHPSIIFLQQGAGS